MLVALRRWLGRERELERAWRRGSPVPERWYPWRVRLIVAATLLAIALLPFLITRL